MLETWVRSLGWEDPLEKRKAIHSSILAWGIPWTVQSMGSQGVGHRGATITFPIQGPLCSPCASSRFFTTSTLPPPPPLPQMTVHHRNSMLVKLRLIVNTLQRTALLPPWKSETKQNKIFQGRDAFIFKLCGFITSYPQKMEDIAKCCTITSSMVMWLGNIASSRDQMYNI